MMLLDVMRLDRDLCGSELSPAHAPIDRELQEKQLEHASDVPL